MELIKKSLATRLKNLADKVFNDNLFLLSSSVSYYSALAIAPFLLILLAVASLIGEDIQNKVTKWASDFSPAVGKMMDIIFDNVQEGVNLGSLSGMIGLLVLFWTASLVFLQMRYAMDVIYGYHEGISYKSIWAMISEKLFAMLVVFLAGIFLIISSSLPGAVQFFFGDNDKLYFYKTGAFVINFIVYVWMFWCIHYVTPSKRPRKRDAFYMGLLSAVFFIIGNVLLGFYFRGVASSSIYGAAGSLLIFLIWTYYSSFTLFLSIELFLFLKKTKKLT